MSTYVNQQWAESVTSTNVVTYAPTAGNFLFTDFSVGCDTITGDNSSAELYWDQSGNQTNMQLIDVIYTSGTTYDNSESQNILYVADGTAQFVVKMQAFNGVARQVYVQVQGLTA
jgi:hypothetical protein